MTIHVYPVDAIAGAPSYTGRALRETLAPLLAGASAADPFGVRSGVRPGTSPTTVTATSTLWTVGAHAGVLDLETAVEASGYAYAVNATGGLPTGAVTAANATYPRHDVVYAHLDDPAESDGSSVPAVTFGYVTGTVLTAGTLEITGLPARSVAYATVNVPLSGGGSPIVTWTAPYTVAAGAPTPVYSAADRDAKFPVPYDGLQVYRLDTHVVETYDGTLSYWSGTWVAPTMGDGWSDYNTVLQATGYKKSADGRVALRGMIKNGGIVGPFTLPPGFRPTKDEYFITSAGGGGLSLVKIVAATGVVNVTYQSGGTNALVSLCGITFSVLS